MEKYLTNSIMILFNIKNIKVWIKFEKQLLNYFGQDGNRHVVMLVAFVFMLHIASRANVRSQWHNMTVRQIMVLPDFIIIMSHLLCSLQGAWKLKHAEQVWRHCNVIWQLVNKQLTSEWFCGLYKASKWMLL